MKEHKILVSTDRTYLNGNRSEDVFISRIRMKPPPEGVQPLCESCGRILTIKHLLVENAPDTIWTQSEAAGRPGTALCSGRE
jgi:hypothetical protein